MTAFDEAFERVIGHEGGFQNSPNDRGNWTTGIVGKGANKGTKYGISAMTYPSEDIKNLTLDRAKELYRRDFWGPAGCDSVPDAIKFDLFDMAVNSGVRASVRALQKAVGAFEDGILGPRTLLAVQSMPVDRVRARFAANRLLFMTTLSTWPAFGRGWVRRVAENLMTA